MKKIYLSGKDKHLFCLVDDEDFNKLSEYKWYLNRKGYAIRCRKYKNKIPDNLPISMQTMILGKKEGLIVDHINNNKLDNQTINLRHITNTDNIRRRGSDKRSTTGFKGVYLSKNKNLKSTTVRFTSYIRVNRKLIFVGYFKNKKEAALAYNRASKKYHGEYGFQNAT